MKKIPMLFILLFLFPLILGAQVQNPHYYEHLYYTCKVWGYIKYFHPQVSAGHHENWDNELTTTFKKLGDVQTDTAFQDILIAMFDSAGIVEHATTPPPNVPDSLAFNLNFNWMSDSTLSPEVQARLDSIRVNFRPHSNPILGEAFQDGNLTFDADSQYYQWGSNSFPAIEYRFLGLCRYWNIINYFSPHKNIMDQDWDSSLVEFIPRFINAKDAVNFNLSMLELASRLNDTHAYTYSETINSNIVGSYNFPLVLDYVEGETVVTRVLQSVDLMPGDILKEMDGIQVSALRDSLRPFVAASTPAALERNINNRLLRGPNTTVLFVVQRNDSTVNVNIRRTILGSEYLDLLNRDASKWHKIETDGREFGYVHMGLLEVDDISGMFGDLWECPSIIFDIRNYPNETLWYMINYLFDKPIIIIRSTRPNINHPGTFRWKTSQIGSGDFRKTYQGHVVLLFNKDTESQAEYTCMGFEQHPKAIKIGSQTSGADGNVSRINLPGGIVTYFTGLGVFYPDGTPTQRIGIIPDYEVQPTINGIREGCDEVLDFAVELLKSLVPSTIEQNEVLPIMEHNLSQNYPNPFNPSTTITYNLPQQGRVKLTIYNLNGQLIRRLVDEEQSTGKFYKIWDANDDFGQKVGSGVYIYRLQFFSNIDAKKVYVAERKMLLIK